jgi:taurine dioxygenase
MGETTKRRRGGPRSVADWTEGQPYDRITVEKATPTVGAYVSGVDLADVDDETVAEIRRALNENCVLFFRDQGMSVDEHISFGRRFGSPSAARANGEEWHSDVSCLPAPPMGSILHMHVVPPAGGDTLFSSMNAAYEALSDRMKAYLDGMTAVHDGAHIYGASDFSRKDGAEYPRAVHPVVRTHPETGRKCLFVNRGFTTRLSGVPRDESDAVLEYLYRHMEHPNFQVRFTWQPGSVAFWDNRSAQHRAIWDYWPHRRTGNRVTVQGDIPY